MSEAVPSLSIVMEWENAGRIGAERANRTLRTLRTQLGALGSNEATPHQIILVYDPRKARPDRIAESMTQAGRDWPAEITYVEAAGDDYYCQKNRGAALARNEILVFLDSDVVPEAGWLAALIAPFSAPEIEVVCGNTYVAPESLYTAAMALIWLFPLRSEEGGLVASRYFYANNVAFRRTLFARHAFPETGQFRGQCGALADLLRARGHRIHLSRDAQVAHPPPQGFKAFVVRALWGGHDTRINARLRGARLHRGTGLTLRKTAGHFSRIFRDRRRVGLGISGACIASALAILYQGLVLAGDLAAGAAPELFRRGLERADV